MDYTIRPVEEDDWEQITSIFNHFVVNSHAAYPEEPVEISFFRTKYLQAPDYPFMVASAEGEVVGFAYLAPFQPVPTMRRSAMLTYFICPDHTGKRLGERFLDLLVDAGKRLGVTTYLAHISSANDGSIRFHSKHGFTECGRFREVGVKGGRTFDMVWMQRIEEV
jgi:phosphinothricin acetyltransferase